MFIYQLNKKLLKKKHNIRNKSFLEEEDYKYFIYIVIVNDQVRKINGISSFIWKTETTGIYNKKHKL